MNVINKSNESISGSTAVTSKRDFGSFMSSNVNELVRAPEDAYVPPKFPFDLPVFTSFVDNPPEFGSHLKEKLFCLEPNWTFVNHGAFGCPLKDAMTAKIKWQMHEACQPCRFIDRELFPHLAYIVRRLAKFVGCKAKDLVLTQNATTATNSILRSFPFKAGDVIYYLSSTYGATKKLISYLADLKGLVVHEEPVNFPLKSKQELIDLVDRSLPQGAALAILDHIPSNQAYITPLQEVIAICRQRGVRVFVDGAHALGNLKINISEIDPDFYVSNTHKWFCNPPGCAFLYIKPKHQSFCHSAVISHGYASGLQGEFLFTGLQDYSSFLSLHSVMDFWQAFGEDRIYSYCHNLIREAALFLTKSWDSGLLAPLDMCSTMAVVRLPSEFNEGTPKKYEDAEKLQNILHHSYRIEVPFKAVQGELYVRISAHIYNDMRDYQRLNQVVLELKNELKAGLE